MSFERNEEQEGKNPASFEQWKKIYLCDLKLEFESFLEDKYDEYIRNVTK